MSVHQNKSILGNMPSLSKHAVKSKIVSISDIQEKLMGQRLFNDTFVKKSTAMFKGKWQ
jgi:hypothetical protein